MMDSAGPPALPEAAEPEVVLPEAEMAETDDDEQAEGSAMESEPADGSEPEDGVALTPTAPLKRWQWTSSFNLSLIHDDNIYISSTNKVADDILKLGADFTFTWGDYVRKQESYLTVHYAPSELLFFKNSGEDAFEQEGSLAGQWRSSKLTLGVLFGAQSLSGGDVDVGDRAQRQIYQFALTSKYELSDKTSLEANFNDNISSYKTHLGSTEWVNQDWVNYQVLPKTQFSAGLTLGYLQPEGSSAQTYEQALLRLTVPATGKLSVTANGGVEFRQLGGAAGSQTKPVFRVGASYRPFDGTEVSLEASRLNFSSAALAAQNYTSTSVSASIRQRIFQRFSASLSGGYEDAQYEGTDAQASTSRHDRYIFARPSLSFAFTKWISLELYDQYRRNTSTAALSSFDGNIAGVQATVIF